MATASSPSAPTTANVLGLTNWQYDPKPPMASSTAPARATLPEQIQEEVVEESGRSGSESDQRHQRPVSGRLGQAEESEEMAKRRESIRR